MSNKYPTANITLSSIEDKGLTLKIKDSEGKSWTLWKNEYQTNQPSEAYEALMNYKIGETFGVTYGEKEEEYQGKSYTKRTIYSVMPPVSNPSPGTKPNPLYTKTTEPPKDDRFWDMKAYKQCLWNYWLETDKNGPIAKEDMDLVWSVFNAIDQDAKKRFFDFSASVPKASEPLPIIDSETPAQSLGGDNVAFTTTCNVCGMAGVKVDDGHDCIPF